MIARKTKDPPTGTEREEIGESAAALSQETPDWNDDTKAHKKEDPKTTTEVSKVHKGRTEDKIIKDRTDLDVLVSPDEEFKVPAW